MSLVDRVNRWILSRTLGKAPMAALSLTPQSLVIRVGSDTPSSIPWNDISRIVVLTHDTYVPTDFRTMLIIWGEGHAVEINEEMAGWNDLVGELENFLPGSQPSGQWLLQIQAAPNRPITIYERPKTASPAS